ncbi:MAG: AAA family ATPase [Bacilli bacterium]|jgi:deoxyadenosine/deoxycytidine kinase
MARTIIIAGDLASGKSILARRLSLHFKVPYFSKERLKEILGDIMPYSELRENKKISRSALDILIHINSRMCKVGNDVILEANFHKEELERIKRDCDFYKQDVVLLYLTGDIETLYERLLERGRQNRHPVHLTHPLLSIEEFENYVYKWREEEEVMPRTYIDVTGCEPMVVYAKAIEALDAIEQSKHEKHKKHVE